jgi:hypothetical protein
MFRKGIRAGIQAVRRGLDPKGVVREADQVIPTYTQQTVLRVPPAADPDADRELLRRVARQVAAGQYDVGSAGAR